MSDKATSDTGYRVVDDRGKALPQRPDGFSLDGHGGARVCFECSEVLEVWFDNDPMEPNPRMVVSMEDGGVAGGIGRAEFVASLRQMADWIEGYGREA